MKPGTKMLRVASPAGTESLRIRPGVIRELDDVCWVDIFREGAARPVKSMRFLVSNVKRFRRLGGFAPQTDLIPHSRSLRIKEGGEILEIRFDH